MKMQKITENHNKIENLKEDDQAYLERNKHLYVAGKISGIALKTILKSAKYCFIPSVSAAAKDDTPKKPPPMKYKDLPIYDSPHHRWKEFENDKIRCPDRKVTHEFLLPTVTEYRKQVSGIINTATKEMKDTYQEISRDYRSAEKKILNKMRCPDKINQRMAFVAAAGIAGFVKGKSIPRRIFLSSVLLFVTGSMCFPKETDEATRTVLYMLGKAFVPMYNFYFRTDWLMRERVPCERDLPKIPTPPTKPLPACAPKK
ncbi:uncharacterized protein LOC133532191 [Cydia pomonella]|uniref:uncharacterized protein LOC133532191 n=1 Tax=Cydia pomonella TaxID=82600 RepID=UPI002ADD9526|nr:uncharacterized protein LOC133532191 [Cydia pomonella]